jgi:glycosyltransferase involved in cell wall biosynthesis
LVDRSIVAFAGLRKDVPAIVHRANVLFSTSLHEGFPNVVLEAMAVGTPVVSTDFSDIRKILPCDWQVVLTRDAGALAAAILRVDRERSDVAARQLEWVRRHGTIGTAADHLEATFRLYVPSVVVQHEPAARVAR